MKLFIPLNHDIRGRSQTTFTRGGRYLGAGGIENVYTMQIFPYM